MEPVVKKSLANLVGRVMDNEALSNGSSPYRHHPSQAAAGMSSGNDLFWKALVLLWIDFDDDDAAAVVHKVLEVKAAV